jgi:hypothetical protein
MLPTQQGIIGCRGSRDLNEVTEIQFVMSGPASACGIGSKLISTDEDTW